MTLSKLKQHWWLFVLLALFVGTTSWLASAGYTNLRAQQRQRMLADSVISTTGPLMVVSLDMQILEATPQCLELFGKQLIGKHIERIIPPDYLRDHRDGVATSFWKRGVINHMEDRKAMKLDGTVFPARITITGAIVAGEKAYVVEVKDTTEQLRRAKEFGIKIEKRIQEVFRNQASI